MFRRLFSGRQLTAALFSLLLPVLLVFAAPLCAAAATTYYVAPSGSDTHSGSQSAPFLTIQHGVNVAASGDTVSVAAGTYSGPGDRDIDFLGKSLTVMSQSGAGSTIIDCGGYASSDGSGNHRGFYIHSGELNATISGFTVKNGYETYISSIPNSGNGGGIFNDNISTGTITLTNCTVTSNTAQDDGGGIYNENDNGGTITLTNCTVTGNTAQYYGGGGIYNANDNGSTITLTNCTVTSNTAQYGGGIYNENISTGTITLTNCTVTSNTAQDGGGIYNENDNGGTITLTNCTVTGNTAQDGGGIYNENDNGGTITLTNCTVTGNTAQYYGGGGIYNYSYNGTITLTNCTVTANTAQYYGGGIYNAKDNGSTITLTNCTVTGNTAQYYGGGIYNYSYNGTITLTNCTVTANTAQYGGGIYNVNYNTGTITLTNDIVYGDTGSEVVNDTNSVSNAIANYTDIQGGYPGTGNIDADPLFINAAYGDLHLKSGSSCIGKGTASGAPTTDFDGNVRGNPPSMGAYDIGVQGGFWTPLNNAPKEQIGLMLLLTDGRVMAQGYSDNTWYALTPDVTGSYVNGTWSQLASMQTKRVFFVSQVLQNGDVLIAGESTATRGGAVTGNDSNTAEIYHTLTNTWGTVPTPTYPASYQGGSAWTKIGDAAGITLADGRVMIGSILDPYQAIYDYTTNTWTPSAFPKATISNEESWALLPDGTVLTVDAIGQNAAGPNAAERYISYSDSWVSAGAPPNVLVESNSAEIGPGMLMPNGEVLYIGATGHTALYSHFTGNDIWQAGPDLYGNDTSKLLAMKDAPGCVEVNGKVLLLAAPDANNVANSYPTGQHFLEYTFDTTQSNGSVVEVPTPPAAAGYVQNNAAYTGRMLQLPNGQVLFTSTNDNGLITPLFVYTPDSGPNPAWLPTVSNIAKNGDGSYLVSGTQFNGLSIGASYGDDVQVASNYPLVRLTDGSGHVYYARTFDHSTMGVATGSTQVSTNFTLPLGLPNGSYSLSVVANGIASAATPFTLAPPIMLSSLSSSPSSVTGGSGTVTGMVALTGRANSTTVISLTSSNPAALTVPASVTIGATYTTAHFYATSHTVSTTQTVTITATLNGVTKTTTVTVNPVPVALASVSASPTSVTGGSANPLGFVALTGKATATTVISLTSSSPAALAVPSSVTIGATYTTAHFYTTSYPVTSDTTVTITATLNGVSKTTTITVLAPELSSVSASPSSVKGGSANATGTVTLTGKAASNVAVNITSSNPAALSVSYTLNIGAGYSSRIFTATSHAVTSSTTVTLTAKYNGITQTTTVMVTP